ncbi:hypothetical protein J2S34_002335 [Nitrobacter winogradskyi]|uniref:Uncharacterized protein n=1 Tax=Nitrobacter winogradskyi TaxID=913 RepID=A0ACC6AL23_NITWI|nr:hypothetical protein [Nitrobacter winogradskyi]
MAPHQTESHLWVRDLGGLEGTVRWPVTPWAGLPRNEILG